MRDRGPCGEVPSQVTGARAVFQERLAPDPSHHVLLADDDEGAPPLGQHLALEDRERLDVAESVRARDVLGTGSPAPIDRRITGEETYPTVGRASRVERANAFVEALVQR